MPSYIITTLYLFLCSYISPIITQIAPDPKRRIPFDNNRKYYEGTSVGPYWDIDRDISVHEFIRQSNLQEVLNAQRQAIYDQETVNLNKEDGEYWQFDYRKIVKSPVKGPKFETLADWFLYYKGNPFSLIACCVIILPILFAGLIQMCIDGCRSKSARISRRTWEFPLVPVLLLQQSRREYLLRKKTVRRFCIQWEVGRINIRMNTKLVDLRQILHPPRKQKKVHKYTIWRIIRLITRFNAFLATRKAAQQKSTDQLKAVQKARIETWNHKINNSKYMVEKSYFDQEQKKKERDKERGVHKPNSIGIGGNVSAKSRRIRK